MYIPYKHNTAQPKVHSCINLFQHTIGGEAPTFQLHHVHDYVIMSESIMFLSLVMLSSNPQEFANDAKVPITLILLSQKEL